LQIFFFTLLIRYLWISLFIFLNSFRRTIVIGLSIFYILLRINLSILNLDSAI
jgi:hypothetical protein